MSGLTCSREPSSKHSEGHHSALGPLEGSGAELVGSSIAWTQPVSTRRRNWNRGQSGTAGDQAMGVEHHCPITVCILFHLLPPVAQRPNLGPCLRWASAGWSSGLWRKHSYPANTHVTQIDKHYKCRLVSFVICICQHRSTINCIFPNGNLRLATKHESTRTAWIWIYRKVICLYNSGLHCINA